MLSNSITDENGYLSYSIDKEEIYINNIEVYKKRKGTGRKLLEIIKDFSIKLELPIRLHSYPQNDSISEDDLRNFYLNCGFYYHHDDSEKKYFEWKQIQ